MKKLDWYLFRQLLAATLFVTVTLTGVVWLMQSLRFIEMIVNRGLSVPVFVYFTFLLLPTFISVILPISLVAAVIFVYNRLLTDSELIVMRAGGYSQFGLAKPAIVLSFLILIVSFSLSLYLLPSSFRNFKDLEFSLRNSLPTVLLQEGVFNQMTKGITVYIRKREKNGELQGIVIHDTRTPKTPITIMADKGAIVAGDNGPRVIMVDGNRQQVDRNTGQLSLLYFDRYSFDLDTVSKDRTVRWREPKERYLHELFFPDSQEKILWNFHKLRMEGHYRLSMPLLPLGLTLSVLAFLLSGDFNRRGQLWRVLAAVGVTLCIELGHLGVQNLGERTPQLTLGMYAVPLLPAGIALFVMSPWSRIFRRTESRNAPSLPSTG